MLYVPLFVFDKISFDSGIQPLTYKGVLVLWHVDTFEGGSGSRAEFLKSRAIEFEKQNKGVLISVQSYTPQQVEQKLAQGERFDIISFSSGTGHLVADIVFPYTKALNVRDDLLEGGKINGKVYALPWVFGGYLMCGFDQTLQKSKNDFSFAQAFEFGYTKNDKNKTKIPSLGVGFAQFNDPIHVLAMAGAVGGSQKWSNDVNLTSYQAYQGFLDKKYALLLGTQRDLSRLKLRRQQGRLEDVSFVYATGYTDLVQYFSFCDNGDGRGELSQLFMQFVTSDECQKKLEKIEMFSPSLDVYESGWHFDMQQALSSWLDVPNVFCEVDALQQQRKNSLRQAGI